MNDNLIGHRYDVLFSDGVRVKVWAGCRRQAKMLAKMLRLSVYAEIRYYPISVVRV